MCNLQEKEYEGEFNIEALYDSRIELPSGPGVDIEVTARFPLEANQGKTLSLRLRTSWKKHSLTLCYKDPSPVHYDTLVFTLPAEISISAVFIIDLLYGDEVVDRKDAKWIDEWRKEMSPSN